MRMAMTSEIRISSCGSLEGRLSSSAISFTKELVTMKKISMMKTMSSIGVMLISASSSPPRPASHAHQYLSGRDLSPSTRSHLHARLLLEPGSEVQPERAATSPDMVGMRRLARRPPPSVARLPVPAKVITSNTAIMPVTVPEQPEQGQHRHQRLNEQQEAATLEPISEMSAARICFACQEVVSARIPDRLHRAHRFGSTK
jgi:hypothetical protein